MTTSYTLTGKIRDIAGEQARSAMAFLSTNLGELGLSDLDANEVRLSAAWRVPLAADGTFSISLIGTNQATTNIAPNTLRYRITVHHKDPSGQQLTWDSGLFAHTAPQDLSDVVAAGVPPVLANEYLSKSLVDAKGDLLVGTAADTVARLPVGANYATLFADSGQAGGLRWGFAGELPRSLSNGTTDVNAVVAAGTYFVDNGSAPNLPIVSGGFLEVRASLGGSQVLQHFTTNQSTRREFIRRSTDSGATWSGWEEVALPSWGGKFLVPVVIERNGSAMVDARRTDAPADAKRWVQAIDVADGSWTLDAYNDAGSWLYTAVRAYRDGNRTDLNGIRHIKGTGFPEGVVSAPVGSRYVDTAATNGAVEWIKDSGTGNTGWRVVYGDTGWRAIASSILAPWTDQGTMVRRTDGGVFISVAVTRASGSGVEKVLDLPSGFAAYTDQTGSLNAVDAKRMGVGGNVTPSVAISGPIRLYGFYATPLGAAWPSSLPGTAA